MVDHRRSRRICKQVIHSGLPIELSHDLHACVNVLMQIDIFSGMYTSLGTGDILVRILGSWEKIIVDQRRSRRISKQVIHSALPIELSHDLHACVNVLMHIDIFSGMYTSLGTGDILVRILGSWEKIMVDRRSPLISSERCPFFILGTWIIAMAVHSPYLVALKPAVIRGQLACVWRRNEAFGESPSLANYITALTVVPFYNPIVLLIVLYSIIVIKLKSQQTPGEQSANAEQVLGFAVLCWVPATITGVLLMTRDSLSCDLEIAWFINWFVALSNCAINPLICFFFSSNYWNGLKRLLRCFSATVQND